VNDQVSQADKRQVMHDTFLARQQTQPDDAGGRYARLTPGKITGATPSPIPRQPATSPWSKSFDEIVGKEPELGFAVDAQEPVGESAEIERSLSQLGVAKDAPAAVPSPSAEQHTVATSSDGGSLPISTVVKPCGNGDPSEPPSTPTVQRRV
jgi:hypothetical protein